MSGWRAIARELGVLPSTTRPAELIKPGPREVSSVSSVLSQRKEPLSRDLARDLFEERAAIREYDGGLAPADAEALAVEDTARALGMPVDEVRWAVMPEALPFYPCTRCGGGDYWKPACLPFEGEGWRCAACHPADTDEWRHSVSVPRNGVKFSMVAK